MIEDSTFDFLAEVIFLAPRNSGKSSILNREVN